MHPCLEHLNALRSQKEAGAAFNFTGAVYTIIPKDGTPPKFVQPLRGKTVRSNLVAALEEAREQDSIVIAAWVGQYKTDMFLIDDMETVIQELSQ